MTAPGHQRAAVLASALILMATLVGCSQPEPQGETVTPYEAQAELVTLMDRLQTELGGEWENQDDPTPLSCDIRGGGSGVQFTSTRLGQSPGTLDDAGIAADRVTELFTAEGYEVRESELLEEVGYDLTMTNNRGSNLNFVANQRAMGMTAGSNCVPGDIDEILDDLREQGF